METTSLGGRIARLAIPLTLLSIVAALVLIASDLREISLLQRLQAGDSDTIAEIDRLATENDNRQAVVGWSALAVNLAALVSFFVWLYLSNKRARAAGARRMRFSPGWTVGWFFIPIFNLWKPYQAVTDIYEASKDPVRVGTMETSKLLVVWWGLAIVSWLANNAAFRLTFRAETIEEVIRADLFTCISNGLDIIASIAALLLISEINKGFSTPKATATEAQVPPP